MFVFIAVYKQYRTQFTCYRSTWISGYYAYIRNVTWSSFNTLWFDFNDHNIITIRCALGFSKHHVKRYRESYTVKYVHVLGKKSIR